MDDSRDVCNGEPQYQRPNHAECELEIAVDDICSLSQWILDNSVTIYTTFRANVRQLDASACNKLEGFNDVFRLLHTHSRGFVISTERDVPCFKK